MQINLNQINTATITNSAFASRAELANVTITLTSQTIYTVSTSNNYTMSESVSDANTIVVSMSGLVQIPWTSYTVYGNTTLRLNNTAPLASSIPIEIRFI